MRVNDQGMIVEENVMIWKSLIGQVDNWIWFFLAAAAYIAAKVFEIPEMNALAGVCIVKIKAENGNAQK